MTTMAMKDIGFCAHFSQQGDWAFEFALAQARRLQHRLNIFYFPGLDWSSTELMAQQRGRNELVALDRRVREYYDEKLGDFVEVGFRVCEDLIDTELRRCLFRKEYQLMVLGYLDHGAMFGNVPIETFAHHFNGPVILVGPDRPDQLYLNSPARVVSWQLGLADDAWTPVPVPAEAGTLP